MKKSTRVAAMNLATVKPRIIVDSRFGLRKMPKSIENSSIVTYTNPGRGNWTSR